MREHINNHLLEWAEGWGQLISFGKGQHHFEKSNESANQKPHKHEDKAKQVSCVQKKLNIW